MEHRIDTGDARPIRQGLRRQPQAYLQVIDEEVEKMAASGVIEPSASPWAFNIVVVSKHDKTPRITLDYRALNDITYKDSYPLPNISDCLDAFRGASFFGILDLRSSFYQVPLAEQDRDKTAFITRRGQWRFRSLPMGLSNSPGTFQRLMDLVLRGLTWSSVLMYIDDIVVYASSFNELKTRLEEVFNRLREDNLKLKLTKVKLFQREISFLGQKISCEGVAMDPEKISEIVEWSSPKNIHEIRQFLGLCSYYRRYVKDFSRHASPLHELTRKDEPYDWNDRRQQAFDHMKLCLTTAPILAMSKEEGQLVLDVDASNWAAGAVLQQYQDGVLKVIAYSSRMFNDCELKYCITRKELAAMIFGLKQYRQYLLGRKFLVRSDHAALQYLRSAKELIGQQARWLDLLEEFTFDIQHRAGLKHGNADSLSRKIPCEQAGGACPQCRKPGKQLKNQAECFAVTTRAKRRVQDKPSQPEYPPIPPDQPPNAIGLVMSDPPDLPFLPMSPIHVNDPPEPLSRPTLSLQNNPGVQDQLAGGEGFSRRDKRKEKRNVRLQKELAAWSNDFLADKQSTDKELAIVKIWLTEGKKPEWNTARSHSPCVKAYWQQYDSLILKDGVMYRQLETIKPESEVIRQLLLPQSLKDEFLRTVHEGVAGHLGMMKTRAHIGSRAYWFQWRRDVDIYCKKCDLCNQYFQGKTPPKQGQLIPMILGALLERWACDLAGPFPKSASGHTHILTAICVFSKYMILVPLRDKTAISVAKAIMENVFLRFGAGELLTDNGCEFRNDLLNEVCRLMGVARSLTTAYEARTNGVCERSHATVNSMLSKCVSEIKEIGRKILVMSHLVIMPQFMSRLSF